MDRSSSKRLVEETFQKPFDKGRFSYFARNLLNSFEEAQFTYQGNLIWDDYEPYIKSIERIGKYQDAEDNKIDILIVHLKKTTSLERARTMQRNLVGKYLKGSRGGELKDAALVAFISPNGEDWRFSLVKMDYKLGETPSGRPKGIEEFTPARRFSFIVGPHENSHTAQSCLVPILEDDEHDPTLKQLEAAFSVEKVTKEFFAKYRELFLGVKESLDKIIEKDTNIKADFENKNVSTVDFAKKLLGQIVFLYFLQKKGWFGVKRGEKWGSGSKHFLRELFSKKHGGYKNFFNDILEPLFYEALRLERPGDYYSRFDCRIPFLNGGLFDPINDYDWWDTDILLPDELFSNRFKTKEGDIGTGILDVFDRYNFTVKEDEPLEKEVAVDPEMLGKVFENLLEVKDRKSKGTYYTPREIVHYMCQESLINYLCTACNEQARTYQKLGAPQTQAFGNEVLAEGTEHDLLLEESNAPAIPREDIETLIKYGETAVEHDSLVENQGRETKTYSYKLPESIRSNAKLIDDKLATIYVCDPAVGSGAFLVGMMNEIIRLRNTLTSYLKSENGRTLYDFKRHAIQKNLYGVDIDPSAVEIAKLRLWLSMIVDEEDIKQIKPLPNLDYKIVCGNSLLGIQLQLENYQLFEELENLKPQYFDETNARKKHSLKQSIDKLIFEITKEHNDFDFEVYFSEVFHAKKGFDVVIANPPYDVLEGSSKDGAIKPLIRKIRARKSEYSYSLGGKLNLYRLFIEKGFKLLRLHGTQSYIVPSTLLADKNTAGLRRMFCNKGQIKFFIEIPEKTKVFENVTQALAIFLIQKTKHSDSFLLSIGLKSKELPPKDYVNSNWKEIESISGPDLFIPLISDQEEYRILKKIHLDKIPLSKLAKIAQGDVNLTVHGEYITDRRTDFLLVRGEHISRFSANLSSKNTERRWIDFDRMRQELSANKIAIIKRDFIEERIVCQNVANMALDFRIIPAIIPPKVLVGHSAEFIIPFKGNSWDTRSILGILSSCLLNWRFKKGSTNNHVNIYELETLPFPKFSHTHIEPIRVLTDKILSVTGTPDYAGNTTAQAQVKEYERQIDQLVYELYGLTEGEIKVVEGK